MESFIAAQPPWKWCKNRSLPLLGALVALIALHPFFLDEFGESDWAFPLGISMVPLFGILALGDWKRAVPVVLMFIALIVMAALLYHGDLKLIARSPIAFLAFTYYGYSTICISAMLLRSNSLIDDRLYGGIAVYLLSAIMFATMHRHISENDPTSYWATIDAKAVTLNWDTSLYFSISTITTVGFGDIVARSPWARALTMLESAAGIFITAVFIARLAAVGLTTGTKHKQK